MSFTRPTLPVIGTRIRADMEAEIDVVPIVRNRTPLAGIARGLAGASHEAHAHIEWTFRQIFADTAETAQLERQASFRGITRRPAARASGLLVFSGEAGTPLPAGTRIGAGGIEIETTADGVVGQGSVTLAGRAVRDGVAGNLAPGIAGTMLAPVAGLDAAVTIAEPGLSGGADIETDAALLARFLFHLRNPPHGGSAADYVRWALEVPGITQAWVAPRELGLGTVTLRIAVDDAPHGPIPTPDEVATVQDHIDTRATTDGLFEGKPAGVVLFVVPPIAAPDAITLSISPDTPAIRSAIAIELAALYRRTARPGGTVPNDRIAQAVALVPGLAGHTLLAPSAERMPALGHLPTLGPVAFA